MKVNLKVFILIIACYSCSDSKDLREIQNIINQNFINFIDTSAYKTGTFYSTPFDSLSYKSEGKELTVLVDTGLRSSKEIKQELQSLLTNSDNSYKKLLAASTNEEFNSQLNLDLITNRGRYKLVKCNKKELPGKEHVGKIAFINPIVNGGMAIIFISLSSFPKAGSNSAFFLEKKGNKWNIIKWIEISRL